MRNFYDGYTVSILTKKIQSRKATYGFEWVKPWNLRKAELIKILEGFDYIHFGMADVDDKEYFSAKGQLMVIDAVRTSLERVRNNSELEEMDTWINRHLPTELRQAARYDEPFQGMSFMTIEHEIYHLQFLAHEGGEMSAFVYIAPDGEYDDQCPDDIIKAMTYARERHQAWEEQLLTRDPLEDDPFVGHGTESELDRLRYEEQQAHERMGKLQAELQELDEIYWKMTEALAHCQQRTERALTKLELLYETLNDYSDPTMTFIKKQLHYIREELGDETHENL